MEGLGAGQLTVAQSGSQYMKLTPTGGGKETAGMREGRQGLDSAAPGTRPVPEARPGPPSAGPVHQSARADQDHHGLDDGLPSRAAAGLDPGPGWLGEAPNSPPLHTSLGPLGLREPPPQWCPHPPHPFQIIAGGL